MPDLSAKAMIDYLVKDRFPTPRVPPIGRVFAAGGSLVSAADQADQMANAAELRGELEKLDGDSLKARYEARVTAKANAARIVAEAAEAAHPFNQPYARAVFDHWGKLTYWKVDEGLALLLGRSPSSLVWENVKHISSPVVWQLANMREVAQRAVHWKQLHDPSYPGSFIIWAKRMQFPVPTELEEKAVAYGQYIGDWNTLYNDLKLKYDQLVNERAATSAQTVTTLNDLREKWTKQYRELSEASSANLAEATAGLAERDAKIEALMDELGKLQQQLAAIPAGRPLGQREADSLRTLIIGMATGGYGYDPTAIRSDAVKDIVDDILKLGLNLSDDTVRKHLKQSAELLPPADSPERNKDR